jgi:hypothetical protein
MKHKAGIILKNVYIMITINFRFSSVVITVCSLILLCSVCYTRRNMVSILIFLL